MVPLAGQGICVLVVVWKKLQSIIDGSAGQEYEYLASPQPPWLCQIRFSMLLHLQPLNRVMVMARHRQARVVGPTYNAKSRETLTQTGQEHNNLET